MSDIKFKDIEFYKPSKENFEFLKYLSHLTALDKKLLLAHINNNFKNVMTKQKSLIFLREEDGYKVSRISYIEPPQIIGGSSKRVTSLIKYKLK